MSFLSIYIVSHTLLNDAEKSWRQFYHRGTWHSSDEKDFFEFIGVTREQRIEYEDSWTLVVTKTTYKKFEVMASKTPHYQTLFKVIEARHGK